MNDVTDSVADAAAAVRRGELVVLPTDTVYGLGADAFSPAAVGMLLGAKGRGREVPPPVLIADAATLDAIGTAVPTWARDLADRHWPGPLTLVVRQQPSLQWDLGETKGTVAVRVPDHDLARDLLRQTGPLAVSSANTHGAPAATNVEAAREMLGDVVSVYLDGGEAPGGVASTIIDCTGEHPRILRQGPVTLDA